jgi:hypothetical protein
MRRTRRLCAITVDTIGRELIVVRESKLDELGWPVHSHPFSVKAGEKVRSACRSLSDVIVGLVA